MKKFYFFAGLLLASFSNQVSVAQLIDFEWVSLPNAESFWNGSDYSGTHNAGVFTKNIYRYEFTFNNTYDTTYSAAYGFWSEGWAFSNQTTTTSGTSGQHSSFAGGASDGTKYCIGQHGSEILITPTSQYGIKVTSIDITNTSYAGNSMTSGDFFAKQFGSPLNADGNPDGTNGEDWFLLSIVGHKADASTDTVDFYLADFRFASSSDDYILDQWETVDLSSLGYIEKLEFLLSSSDVGGWGMNTPGFFAIDAIQFTTASSASIETVESDLTISVFPNPTSGVVSFVSSNNDALESITIVDVTGKVVGVYTSSMASQSIDLSDLPLGVYHAKVTTASGSVIKKLMKI